MVITYYGAACFKAQSGEIVLAFNPPSKDSKFKSPRFQSDIVLISKNNEDFNGWENMAGKNEKETPFLIDGPGEYEISGVCVKGIFDGKNTVYTVLIEDMVLCHLGLSDAKELSSDLKQEIGEADILFVSISKEDGQKAAQTVARLEPRVIIPAYFDDSSLKNFLKETGNGKNESIEKLTIKKKDLAEKKNEIIVLSPCL